MASASMNPQRSTGTRILIVGDDVAVAETLERYVQDSGYPCSSLTCECGKAASAVESYSPELLIVDLPLNQESDHLELTERIRRTRGMPVMFVIGDLDDRTLHRALEADPLGFISKPLLPSSVQGPLALCLKRLDQTRKAQRCAERIRASMDTILRVGMSGMGNGLDPDTESVGSPGEESVSEPSEEASKIKHLETILDRITMTLTSADDSHSTQSPAALPWTRLPSLTAREREVLRWLVAGHRVSTIATKLVVAPSTVRNHLKSIFRKLEVRSQTELLELLNGMN